jgi:hypothetical protein
MQPLSAELTASFQQRLDQAGVPQTLHQGYHKWVGFYIYFCQKYGFPPTAPTALGPFLTKLAAKDYSIEQRHHAATAVRLLVRPDPKDPSLYLQSSIVEFHQSTRKPRLSNALRCNRSQIVTG